MDLSGEEITGGTLPRGRTYLIGAALPRTRGLLRWQGRDQQSGAAVEVLTPAVGTALPRALSRLALTTARGLSRVLGVITLAGDLEVAVLERPAGTPLSISGAARDLGEAIGLLSALAAALDAVHAADVCHLALHPTQVLLTAASAQSPSAASAQSPGAAQSPCLLLTAAARSTEDLQAPQPVEEMERLAACAYLAPELAADGAAAMIDRRADVYALAALAYHLLTGEPPFGPDGSPETLRAHQKAERPRCTRHRADLSEAVEQVLLRGLALDVGERPPSCGELIDDLRAAVAALPGSGQRLSPRPNACILVVAGSPEARRELTSLVTAVAPRQPVLMDGGPHGRTLALRYCPRLCVLHQPSLPEGAVTRLARQLAGEPMLQRTKMLAVVDSLHSAAALELQQLGVALVPQGQLGSARSSARREADHRPILLSLRRLLTQAG